jgi:hypothetical protein
MIYAEETSKRKLVELEEMGQSRVQPIEPHQVTSVISKDRLMGSMPPEQVPRKPR